MPRREAAAAGPERLSVTDIEPLNRLFSDAFTDRYSRDGMAGVRVPHLNPAVWRYAIEGAGAGALAWRDQEGELIAFNLVHRSGSEGWMGPLAVRPDRQHGGLGRMVVRAGLDWLRGEGADTIGLETMPRTVENIGFYSRLGFVPQHLTITLVHDADRRGAMPPEAEEGSPAALTECRALLAELQPGLDFSRELELTFELALGGLTLVRIGGRLAGFALWHTAPLAAGRPRDELRVLKLAAADPGAFSQLVAALRVRAAAERVRRVSIRAQSAFADAYECLIGMDFRVHWTDLRMLARRGAGPACPGAILFSNWEI